MCVYLQYINDRERPLKLTYEMKAGSFKGKGTDTTMKVEI